MRIQISLFVVYLLLGSVIVAAINWHMEWRYQEYQSNRKLVMSDSVLTVDDFNRAIEINSSDALAYQGRAKLSCAQGDKLLALKDIDTAIKLAPNDCMNHLVKGETLWSLSNTNGAMAEFNTACRLRSANFMAYEERALLRCYLRDYHGALADLDKSILLNPKAFYSLHFRGYIHELLGDRLSAARDFYLYWKLCPSEILDTYSGVSAFIARNTVSASKTLCSGFAI